MLAIYSLPLKRKTPSNSNQEVFMHLTFYWRNLQLRTSQNQEHIHVPASEFLNTYQLQTLGLKLPEVHTGQFLHPKNRETAINKNFKNIW